MNLSELFSIRVKPGRKHKRIQKESCAKLMSDRTVNGQLLGFMRKKIRAQSQQMRCTF